MSTILKALQRLEEEQIARTAETSRSASRQALAAAGLASRSSSLGRIGLILASAALAAVTGAGVTWLILASIETGVAPVAEPHQIAAVGSIAEDSPIAEPKPIAEAESEPIVPPVSLAMADSPPDPTSTVQVGDFSAVRAAALADPLWQVDSVPKFEIDMKQVLAEVRGLRDLVQAKPGSDHSNPADGSARVAASATEEPEISTTPSIDLALVTRNSDASASVTDAGPRPVIRTAPYPNPAVRPASQIAKPHPVEHPTLIVRDPVPSVVVTRTTWHPDRGRRRAELEVLQGEELRIVHMREGQFLGPLELGEIRPAGVTFLHNGVEIRRRVGSQH
jgi:hypothetical protein